MARYVYVAQVSIPAALDALFNELYDSQHVPYVLGVPGVQRCTRYKLEWSYPEMAQYMTLWEVDNPDLPQTDVWKAASDKGDWAVMIRPHLTLRLHGMYRALDAYEHGRLPGS